MATSRSSRRSRWNRARITERYSRPVANPCIKLNDLSTRVVPATWLTGLRADRDSAPREARLAHQFIGQNRGLLKQFGVDVNLSYDGSSVALVFTSANQVGAAPMLSPTTGRPDYGIVISPRFPWSGVGQVMGATGWKIVPNIVNLPMLPRSAREIPPWVLSATVLIRIELLLSKLNRRFEFAERDLNAPRGALVWGSYLQNRIPQARFLSVPCRFPDLTDDKFLRGFIHYALRKQLASLESQRSAGVVVLRLLDFCRSLIIKVADAPPAPPASSLVDTWFRGAVRSEVFRNGLEAIDWTVDDRGLAGLTDLHGLPWVMSMDAFFEAWIETLIALVAKRIGGILRSGRRSETTVPISWNPPYLGSQRSLRPDIVLDRESSTLIVDAKYKQHWEKLASSSWHQLADELKERHRDDLLQVLAYAGTANTANVTVMLTYPCDMRLWDSLVARQVAFHRADIRAGHRRIRAVLTAVPMAVERMPHIVSVLSEALTEL